MATSQLILLIAVILGIIEFLILGWTSSSHSSLALHPEGESLAPSFRGIPGDYFKNKDKLWLSYKVYKSSQQPATGNIYLVHGLGGLVPKLENVAEAFSRAGFNVFAHEYQGQGKSEGDPKHMGARGIHNGLDDFVEFTKYIEANEEVARTTKRNYCFGKSMGAIITLTTAMTSLVCKDGLILVAPALNMTKLGPTTSAVLPFLSTFFPKAPIELRDWKTYLRSRAFFTMTQFITEELPLLLEKDGAKLPPFLLLQGDKDTITDPSTSINFFHKWQVRGSELKVLPSWDHHLEANQETVEESLRWLKGITVF